jgi:hypothetical protein
MRCEEWSDGGPAALIHCYTEDRDAPAGLVVVQTVEFRDFGPATTTLPRNSGRVVRLPSRFQNAASW